MSNREYASKQLNKIDIRISESMAQHGRAENSVTLVGAAKQQSAEHIEGFVSAGLQNVGENYLNEALTKQPLLEHLSINWHFIGKVQSNKAKLLARHFDTIHGLEKLSHAQKLAKHVPDSSSLKVLLQLNLDEEDSKGGVLAHHALELCARISDIDKIKLDGFMLIPKFRQNQNEQRAPFAQARELLEQCNQQLGIRMNTLSMGMSNDLEAAIAEGSTMIRVGTDLFGPRV